MERLFFRCPNIKYLNFSEINFIGANNFTFSPRKLLYLNFTNCRGISLEALDSVFKRAPNLETLVIQDYHGTHIDWFPTKLRFFKLSYFYSSEDPKPDFSDLIELERVCLRYNRRVTPESLASLRHCPKLTSIDLSYNKQLDGSVLRILKLFKSLKYCNLSGLKNIQNCADFVQQSEIEVRDLISLIYIFAFKF